VFGTIRAVTTVVPDLQKVEQAYVRYLDYRVIHRGIVDAATAATWRAPRCAGRECLVLGPASGSPVWLRFVGVPDAPIVPALTTHGWNATEILVEDPDALAARLEGSPFRIIGPPRSLTRFPMIRAMQVLGPVGECLYFTRTGADNGLGLPQARAFVDEVFIVVGAGPAIAPLMDWYAAHGNTIDPPVATPVGVISAANGLPPDTLHAHGLIKLPDGKLIELDEYPAACGPRPQADDDLPPGMAMVTFEWRGALPPRATAGAAGLLPGNGANRSAVLVGIAGERVELLLA